MRSGARRASGTIAYPELCAEAAALGLACRGGFQVEPEDGVPASAAGAGVATLVLLGFVGSSHWAAFKAAPESRDGAPDPLDRWSRRLTETLAARHGARALLPFGGPPWLPFQRWAQRAEPLHVSPLHLLIHPVYGLWHAYRGALAFEQRLEVPTVVRGQSPCASCAAKPCLTSCPVQAFRPEGLDLVRCRAHLRAAVGRACYERACLARAACPVGAEHHYGPEQARFHVAAFAGRA